MSQKSYECRQCHKMTVGYPALYRNKCLECRNLEIRTMMEKERLGRLTKTELIQENKKLQAKMRNLTFTIVISVVTTVFNKILTLFVHHHLHFRS